MLRSATVESMVEAVRRIARRNPAAPAFTFVDFGADAGGSPVTMTFGELDLRARAVAAELQAQQVSEQVSGQVAAARVALLLPHDLTYIVGFFGCLYAGAIAVPLFAPGERRGAERLHAVLADCAPHYVVSTVAGRAAVDVLLEECADLPVRQVIPLDEIPDEAAEQWRPVRPDLDEVAYLQYTSGSTSRPAGVRITHRNLVTAAWQIQAKSDFTQRGVVVSWLPYFHDMGLIIGLVLPASAGAHAVHLTPWAFVQDPRRWLMLITRYGGTFTAAPNFAMELCVRRVTGDRKTGLDLSTLTDMVNGSEQVRTRSVQEFTEAFAECGFAERSHSAGYGLAEATLGVSGTPMVDGKIISHFDRVALGKGVAQRSGPASPDAWPLACCGTPLPGVSLRIVDPESRAELPPDRVGEIWVGGANVADGYWGQPERSAEVFGARLAGDPAHAGGWLRTGDLGFQSEGELYVTGRLKDLIIMDGRNHYPDDIESTIGRSLPDGLLGKVAVFSVDRDDTETVVVVAEVRPARAEAEGTMPGEVEAMIRECVAAHHDLPTGAITLTRAGAVPRTSSGKLRRSACRELFLGGGLPAVSWA